MPAEPTVRVEAEQPDAAAAVRALLLGAFPTAAEADLVERLRDDGDAWLGLVVHDGSALAGHLLLSRLRAPFPALGLGPLAVAAAARGRGVGTALMEAGLDRAAAAGFAAVFALGDPAFYGRFGFGVEQAAGFVSPYAGPYFMVRPLRPEGLPRTSGEVHYAPAFAALD